MYIYDKGKLLFSENITYGADDRATYIDWYAFGLYISFIIYLVEYDIDDSFKSSTSEIETIFLIRIIAVQLSKMYWIYTTIILLHQL